MAKILRGVLPAVCALFVLAGVPAVRSRVTLQPFADFAAEHGRLYSSPEEYKIREAVFMKNMEIAKELAAQNPEAEFGVTQFSDLTPEEFAKQYLMSNFSISDEGSVPFAPEAEARLNRVSVPEAFDWRDRGSVTPVINQGSCGSCFAVATAENVESVWRNAGHDLTRLSIQQVLDCDRRSYGCNGGDPVNSYNAIMSTTGGGVQAAATYPYAGRWGSCKYNSKLKVASLSGWAWITKTKNEDLMRRWLYANAPINVCLDASIWGSYRSGVITRCAYRSMTHCVLLTGWTQTTSGSTAWALRNSWGSSWGDKGYIYLKYGQNTCGIATHATSGLSGNVTVNAPPS